jgi:serine phosphatase RsbU (regulator of sigma subunit)
MAKKLAYLFVLWVIIGVCSTRAGAQNLSRASLFKQLKTATAEKKVDLYNQIAEFYKPYYPDSALVFGDSAIALALEINYPLGRAYANRLIGVIQFEAGNIDFALSYFEKALPIYQTQKNFGEWARILNNIGEVYLAKSRDLKISGVRSKKTPRDTAYYFFQQALRLSRQSRDSLVLTYVYVSLANWHLATPNLDSAAFYYQKSLAIAQKRQDYDGISRNYLNLAAIQTETDSSFALLYRAIYFAKLTNANYHLAFAYNKMGLAFLDINQLDSAKNYAQKAMQLALKNTPFLNKEIQKAYEVLIQTAILQTQPNTAFTLFLGYKEILREENDLITRSATNYFHQEKLIQEKLNRQSRLTNLILSLLLLVVLGFLAYVIWNIRKQKRINRLLTQQKQAIEDYAQNLKILHDQVSQQKEELAIKNRNIEDSINYAQRIQYASLPPISEIQKILPEFFVFYQPRNVVSGDFYWFGQVESKPIYQTVQEFPEEKTVLQGFQNEKIILIAADCTGHGVPGAFMSMIGNTLLDEIIYLLNITEPDLILAQLHHKIRDVLRQHQTDVRDGMDIAVCVLDFEKQELAYAGARSPLIVVQGEEARVIGADRIPVGGENYEQQRSYTRHIIPLTSEKPTYFYMLSDGYIDQFGGGERKKLMRANLVKYIQEIYALPMSEQSERFVQKFYDWKMDEEQVDDVLLLGFKI